MFSFDADPNGMAGLAGINSEPTDLPQVGANQPPMPGASDAVALPALVPEGYDNIVLSPEQPVDYGGATAETPLGAILSADPLTGSGDASDRFSTLNDALAQGYEQLKQFAGSPDLLTQMGVAFGNNFNAEVAGYLEGNWSNGIISGPPIEVVSAAEIDWADAAFAGATKTIYISEELLDRGSGNAEVVANAWLEEYGHYVDTLINVADAAGDEGAIFAAVGRGQGLSQERLDALRVESDRAFVVIDGMEVEIEKAALPENNYNEGKWRARFYYKDDPNGAWKRLSQTRDGKQVNLFTGPRRKDGLDTLWPKDGKPSIVPSNDYFAFEAYTIENFEQGQVYEFNVKADDQYRIRAYPLKSVSGGYDAADGGKWEYISEYERNSEGKRVNTWRYGYGGETLSFAPERSGPYLVYAGYIETEGDSFFNLSWDEARSDSLSGTARKDDGQESSIRIQSIDGQPITDRPTWLVIHGNDSNAGKMDNLANAVKSDAPDQQVLTLDWSEAATGIFNLNPFSDESLRGSAEWIKDVAKTARDKLKERGIESNNLNLIGHSLGAYVAYETAKLFSEEDGRDVANLVALDPASWTGGGYNQDAVNFDNYSDWSWAFVGSLGGHFDNAKEANESFQMDFMRRLSPLDEHTEVHKVFADFLKSSTEYGGIDLFTLEDMGENPFRDRDGDGFDLTLSVLKGNDGWYIDRIR